MFGFLKNKKKEDMIREYEEADDTEYYEEKIQHQKGAPWYGVDLDGTLATSEGLKSLDSVGKPVPLMMERVKLWIAQGHKVKIMTARACDPTQIPIVEKWLAKQGYDPRLGARPLRRMVQRTVENVVAKKILKSDFKPGTSLTLDVADLESESQE